MCGLAVGWNDKPDKYTLVGFIEKGFERFPLKTFNL